MNSSEIKARGHKHAEAYCLMTYQSKDAKHTEVLWNSRDGVTPFIISTEDGTVELIHVAWNMDTYAPHFRPPVGMRVFVDATEELKRPWATKYVEQWWDGAENIPPMSSMFASKGEAIAHFSKIESGPSPEVMAAITGKGIDCEDHTHTGEPWIVTVTRGY